MIDSLHIQNYRLFKDLKIDKLGQVNLIAGKNNTGKTALLEALRILVSKVDTSVINNILFNRDSYEKNRSYENHQSLFFDYHKEFVINNIAASINIDRKKFELKVKEFFKNGKIKNETTWTGNSNEYENPRDELVYVSFNNDFEYSGWENFTIEEEENVVGILKLVEKRILDYRIVDSNKPVLRIEGSSIRQSIKGLGDGVNRVFTIAFALVKAKNKILLIDEFEVGLHHSVQKQLWEIIFKYAKEWNIQVFVTTHSLDTIENFYYIAYREENRGLGKYLVLNKHNDNVKVINYDFSDIKFALETNLEIR
jgi:AAA15 family ATPase/GTPase